jgi:hypothetical protein
MKAKIFRFLGLLGFIVVTGALSGCFAGAYYPSPYHGYVDGPSAYAYPQYYPYPEYYPRYVPVPEYVPAPRNYAYRPAPYGQYRNRWEHNEHQQHAQHADGHHYWD